MTNLTRLSTALWVLCLTVLLLGFPGAAQGQAETPSLRLVGSRLTADQDFPVHGQGLYTTFLRDNLAGGRLFVVVANDGPAPVTIEGLEVNGTPFELLSDQSLFGDAIPSLNWWQAAPPTLLPGELSSLRLRLLDVEGLGSEQIQLALRTDAGTVNLEVTAAQPSLWLPSVGFRENSAGELTEAVVYVANSGREAITLPEQGGVRIDEQPVPARAAQRRVDPGEVVPIEVTLDPSRTVGQWTVVEVESVEGVRTIGSLRAFPASFSTSFWQLGFAPTLDEPSLDLYGIDRYHPAANDFIDEPFRVRVAPSELSEQVQASWLSDPERPLMVQLTGYEETLIYSDISDIVMTHHRDIEQDLSLFLSWPKPIWYLPQNAWGRNSQPGADTRWYPLEDLQHQALAGIARGAKHIQWFTFWNLWEQGYGLGGALDSVRNHPDISMSGAVSNPVLLDRVGRLSLMLRMLEPYLAISAPASRYTTPAGIEVTTLVSGSERAVAVLVDKTTPVTWFERTGPGPAPVVLANQTVLLTIPAFVDGSAAFLIDPFEGVRPVPVEQVDDRHVRLQLTRFSSAALVVVGTAEDGAALDAAWQQLDFPNPRGTLDELRAWGQPLPSNWAFPDRSVRLPLTITNDGVGNRSIFDVLVDWPQETAVDIGSLKVVELGASEPRPVLVQALGPRSIVDFALRANDTLEASAVDRFTDLFSLTRTATGLTNRYQSHPDERYRIDLIPRPDPATSPQGGWLPLDYRQLEIEIRGLDEAHEAKLHRLIIDFDLDGDGAVDDRAGLILTDQTRLPLDDGWFRYLIDTAAAFTQRFPGQQPTGLWRPRFEVEVLASSQELVSEWQLRSLTASLDARITVSLSEALAPGEERSFHLYFEPTTTPSLTAAVLPRRTPATLPAVSGTLQHAGVEADLVGNTLTLTPQQELAGVLVRHWGSAGQLRQRERLEGSEALRLELDNSPEAGDLLSLTALLPDGTGHDYLLEIAPAGTDEPAKLEPAWSRPGQQDVMIVDADLSPDGRWLALSERFWSQDAWHGRVRLLDDQGEQLWSWPPAGDPLGATFFARFDSAGDRLYLAAQELPIDRQSYRDAALFAFAVSPFERPRLLWQQPVGAGTENPGRAVHKLVAAPAGGMIYADWNGYIARLDRDGTVVWQSGIGRYVRGLEATTDGGAYALNFKTVERIDASGEGFVVVQRSEGTENQVLWTSRDGSLVAFANSRLSIVGLESRLTTGRHPRVLAGTESATGVGFIAVGSSDGRLQVFDQSGVERWSWEQRGSTVTDLEFLPDGTLIVAREAFRYTVAKTWNYRTEIAAFDAAGRALWEHQGSWLDQPAESRLLISRDGRTLVAVGGEILRIELPR